MELDTEILECARYGEVDDLLAVIEAGGNVNAVDDFGNTALHKAAANGHINCLKILKSKGAIYTKNASGNYPSHWAAQNSQTDALRYLIQVFDEEVDLLAQNEFGRSTMTEAFGANNSDSIEVCLNHSSVSEDRLISSTNPKNDNVGENNLDAVYHIFKFRSDSELKLSIRELPIDRADNPFGTEFSPEDDTTGLAIWPAAILASRWIANSLFSYINGKVVIELGAGCGVPALSAALYCQPKKVYISDINKTALSNCAYNIQKNGQFSQSDDPDILSEAIINDSTIVRVVNMNWFDKITFPKETFDVIIGSDLVYDSKILAGLTYAIRTILVTDGLFLYVAPDENRDGLDNLTNALNVVGITLTSKTKCPEEFYVNPLIGEDKDDNYVLHFYDLPAKKDFSLYVYQKMDTQNKIIEEAK